MNDDLGKRAEDKITQWLDRPEDGYCFDRIKDQMSGFYGSSNICDFTLYKYPNMYYIESKATWSNRFDYSMLTDKQKNGLREKSKIAHVKGLVIVLFASHKRAFIFEIDDIFEEIHQGRKSLNIDRIHTWDIPYKEIKTVQSTRKLLLDYTGDIEEYFDET